jgi:GWxTD domain-containing protein
MSIRLSAICRFIATALFVLGLGLLTFAQAGRKHGSLQSDPPTQADYQKWLDQDVRWIISPQERAVFLKLSNEDRERFMEDFWLHHDKEEHYRQVAYTNDHFTISISGRTQPLPGWLTDRGRIYIAYGPPDAIKETDGDANNASAILWHYDSIPLYGKNVDLRFFDVCGCGDGDYRLGTFPKNR